MTSHVITFTINGTSGITVASYGEKMFDSTIESARAKQAISSQLLVTLRQKTAKLNSIRKASAFVFVPWQRFGSLGMRDVL